MTAFYAFLLILISQAAQADLTNPNVLPLGEMEAFLGNSGVALNNSSGSVYYNPAGLASITSSRVSGSGSNFVLLDAKFDSDPKPISFNTVSSVPSLIVATRRYKRWTGAFSILTPATIDLNSKVALSIPTAGLEANVSLYNRSEENYIGFSAARALSDRWDWGIGVHVLRHSEIKNESLMARPSGAGTLYLSQSKRTKIDVFNLVLISGVQQQVNDNFRWGVNVHTGTFKLSGRADIYEEQFVFNAGTASRTINENRYGANAHTPWQILSGLEWRMAANHRLMADLGWSLPVTNNSIPDSPYDEISETRLTARGSTGYAFRMSKYWEAMTGVELNPSNLDYTVASAPSSRLNYLASTLGFFNRDRNVTSGFGFYYVTSRTDKNFFGRSAVDPTSVNAYGVTITASIAY